MKHAPELLYLIAIDFIGLKVTDKFRIGIELQLLDPFDVLGMEEEDAELRVFSGAYRNGQFEHLIQKMYSANP